MKQQTKDATPSPSKIKYVSIEGRDYPLNGIQTQVQYKGEWYEIKEDQEGENYILAGHPLQAIYIDLPSPSIPVKEELLDITGEFKSWLRRQNVDKIKELTTAEIFMKFAKWFTISPDNYVALALMINEVEKATPNK